VAWFPDGKSVLVVGREKDKGNRAYRQALPDGLPVPVLPDGVLPAAFSPISPNGLLILARDAKSDWQWYPTDTGSPRPIAGLAGVRGVAVVGWAHDRKSPLIQIRNDVPVVIEVVDFATGKRTPFKTITPAEATGLANMRVRTMSPDGQQYAFSFARTISTLFVVTQGK